MSAVPTPDERDEATPSGGLRQEAHRRLAGVRTGESVPDLFLPVSGNEIDQPLGQLDCRSVDPGDQATEGHAPELGDHGRADALIAVAQSGQSPCGAEIKIGPAVDAEEPPILPAIDRKRRIADLERVGDGTLVAPHEVDRGDGGLHAVRLSSHASLGTPRHSSNCFLCRRGDVPGLTPPGLSLWWA